MSVEMACYCDGLPAHSHICVHEWVDVVIGYNLNPDRSEGAPITMKTMRPRDTGEVQIWVDWKAVARAALERS